MAPVKSQPSLKGKEIVDPEMAVFIKLDDLSRLFKKELSAEREILVQLLNTTILNQEHLRGIVKEIRKWREAWSDEGEYRYIENTATTTAIEYVLGVDFVIPLKAYMIANDGGQTIRIGHLSSGSTIDEVNDEKFQSVYSSDQPLRIKSHDRKIRKIVIKTVSGTSPYRLWVM